MVSTICSIISLRNGFIITFGESLAEFPQNPAPRIRIFVAVGDPDWLANDQVSQREGVWAFWIANMAVSFAGAAITECLRTLYRITFEISDIHDPKFELVWSPQLVYATPLCIPDII